MAVSLRKARLMNYDIGSVGNSPQCFIHRFKAIPLTTHLMRSSNDNKSLEPTHSQLAQRQQYFSAVSCRHSFSSHPPFFPRVMYAFQENYFSFICIPKRKCCAREKERMRVSVSLICLSMLGSLFNLYNAKKIHQRKRKIMYFHIKITILCLVLVFVSINEHFKQKSRFIP